MFLPSDQRDKRFLDAYAKYEAEFVHLPSSHDIGNGLVRDPFLLGPDDESSCGSVYGNSDACAYIIMVTELISMLMISTLVLSPFKRLILCAYVFSIYLGFGPFPLLIKPECDSPIWSRLL